MSAGNEEKIRRWRVEDGMEVGTPMDVGNDVFVIAVSRDGKWVVSGTENGTVTVWNAESHKKMTTFTSTDGRNDSVWEIDVSPDGTRVATGWMCSTICVRSLSTGQLLLGPLKHNWCVGAVKFSPDGRFIATATWCHHSVRIYDSQDGHLVVDIPVKISSPFNQSLVWTGDSKQILILSRDNNINCLDCLLARWSLNGPFTPATIRAALPSRAMVHSLQFLHTPRSRSGTPRRTSKSGLESSIHMVSNQWLSHQTTTLRSAEASRSLFAVSAASFPHPTFTM